MMKIIEILTKQKQRKGKCRPYLPLIHLFLFFLVLLHQPFQNTFQPLCISLESRNYICDRPFNENSINQAEAFSVLRDGREGLQD